MLRKGFTSIDGRRSSRSPSQSHQTTTQPSSQALVYLKSCWQIISYIITFIYQHIILNIIHIYRTYQQNKLKSQQSKNNNSIDNDEDAVPLIHIDSKTSKKSKSKNTNNNKNKSKTNTNRKTSTIPTKSAPKRSKTKLKGKKTSIITEQDNKDSNKNRNHSKSRKYVNHSKSSSVLTASTSVTSSSSSNLKLKLGSKSAEAFKSNNSKGSKTLVTRSKSSKNLEKSQKNDKNDDKNGSGVVIGLKGSKTTSRMRNDVANNNGNNNGNGGGNLRPSEKKKVKPQHTRSKTVVVTNDDMKELEIDQDVIETPNDGDIGSNNTHERSQSSLMSFWGAAVSSAVGAVSFVSDAASAAVKNANEASNAINNVMSTPKNANEVNNNDIGEMKQTEEVKSIQVEQNQAMQGKEDIEQIQVEKVQEVQNVQGKVKDTVQVEVREQKSDSVNGLNGNHEQKVQPSNVTGNKTNKDNKDTTKTDQPMRNVEIIGEIPSSKDSKTKKTGKIGKENKVNKDSKESKSRQARFGSSIAEQRKKFDKMKETMKNTDIMSGNIGNNNNSNKPDTKETEKSEDFEANHPHSMGYSATSTSSRTPRNTSSNNNNNKKPSHNRTKSTLTRTKSKGNIKRGKNDKNTKKGKRGSKSSKESKDKKDGKTGDKNSNDEDGKEDDEKNSKESKQDNEFRNRLMADIIDEKPNVSFKDVQGLENVKLALYETIILPQLMPDIFTGLREPTKGLLLFGPPGNGKTMIAKCVASECSATFFSISASSITSKFVGDAERIMRTLFNLAREKSPSIIFIDEIDSLLTARGGKNEAESSRRIKTEFLIQFDGVKSDKELKSKILVIGATNLPWQLDDAVLRRFGKRIMVPLPDKITRLGIIKHLMFKQSDANKCDLDENDLDKIVSLTDGYSGSDLSGLCKDAAMGPLRDCYKLGINLIDIKNDPSLMPQISISHFMDSCKNVRPSLSNDSLTEYFEWNDNFGSKMHLSSSALPESMRPTELNVNEQNEPNEEENTVGHNSNDGDDDEE